MKKIALSTAAIVSGAILSCYAQGNGSTDSTDRVSLSYRAGFNINAKFTGLGGFPAQTDPGPASGAGLNRRYDDGYNLLDSAGNAGGLTWNWGYSGASGQLPGNDTLVMHSSSSAATAASKDRDGDPQHGFELAINHRLGTAENASWGVEFAFNFTDITVKDSQKLSAPVQQIQDAYSLGGIVPPLAPYSGSFGGPGGMISDSPNRTTATIPDGASITGHRDIDANLFGWRLGPYVDVPLGRSFFLTLSGGLSVAYITSDFNFNNTVSISGLGSVNHAGSTSDSDWLVGAFLGGTLSWKVTEAFSVFGGAQYQYAGDFAQSVSGATAHLDLSATIFVSAGLSYSF